MSAGTVGLRAVAHFVRANDILLMTEEKSIQVKESEYALLICFAP